MNRLHLAPIGLTPGIKLALPYLPVVCARGRECSRLLPAALGLVARGLNIAPLTHQGCDAQFARRPRTAPRSAGPNPASPTSSVLFVLQREGAIEESGYVFR